VRENLRKQEVHEETAGPGPTFRKEERKGNTGTDRFLSLMLLALRMHATAQQEANHLSSITIFFPYRPPARRRGRRQYASVRQTPADKAGGRYGKKMAGEEGFEPSNAGIKIRCLNQLGDSPTGGLNGPMLQWVFFKTGTYYHRSDRICCHTQRRDCSLNFGF
jgi:hypothetical protein